MPLRELLARWSSRELSELVALFQIEREEMQHREMASEAVDGIEQMKAEKLRRRH